VKSEFKAKRKKSAYPTCFVPFEYEQHSKNVVQQQQREQQQQQQQQQQHPTSKKRTRKRKNGDVALAQQGITDLQEIKNQKIATMGEKSREKYAKKYATSNRKKAGEVIDWLVSTKQTTNLCSGVDEEPHSNGWWFNWQKVDQIGDDVALFCSSKQRMLSDGITVANEAVSNLSKYRTAVKHYILKATVGTNSNIVFNALLAKMQTQMTALQQMQTQMNNIQNVKRKQDHVTHSMQYRLH